MKIAVIVQARMRSTRLPGKVMLPLAGRPLLHRMLERVLAARIPFELAVATSTVPADDPIRDLCGQLGIRCFSGDEADLLDRHYRCAREMGADIVVKIPSDCPLIDPQVIDAVLTVFLGECTRYDYVSNLHPATFPDGNDVEVMSFRALELAWRSATKEYEREHTTPFLWDNPERFVIGNVTFPGGQNYALTHRWTIDYPEDYEFISAIYGHLWHEDKPIFSMHDILNLLDRNPELAAINSRYAGVNWYRNHLHELTTIDASQTRRVTPV